jgi:hypothetical protein
VAFDEARGGTAIICGLASVLAALAGLTLTQYDDGPVLAKNADLGMRSEDFAIGIGPTLFEAGIVSSTHDLRVLILYHAKN